jgi:hypothetical protein
MSLATFPNCREHRKDLSTKDVFENYIWPRRKTEGMVKILDMSKMQVL